MINTNYNRRKWFNPESHNRGIRMENQNNKQVVVTLRNKSNKTRKKERRFGRKEEENLRNKRKQRQKIVSLITNSFPSSIAASL